MERTGRNMLLCGCIEGLVIPNVINKYSVTSQVICVERVYSIQHNMHCIVAPFFTYKSVNFSNGFKVNI